MLQVYGCEALPSIFEMSLSGAARVAEMVAMASGSSWAHLIVVVGKGAMVLDRREVNSLSLVKICQ